MPLQAFYALKRGAAAGIILLSAAAASAETLKTDRFFEGRQLTMLIGGGAGGSVDIYARILARHIVNHLPGKPTIVARNLPSAGGVQAFMTLGTTAPRDGSTFATSARGPLTDPILSDKPAPYDPRSFIWIGSINEDSSVCFTGGHSNVRTIEDARTREATMASTGALAESSKFPLAVNALTGAKLRVITGYKGAADTKLAVARGEVDGQCTTFGSMLAVEPDAFTGNKYNFLVQIGEQSNPLTPNAPVITQFLKSESDRRLLDIIVKPLLITSSYALPPSVPSDRVEIWRTAFDAAIKDSSFLSEAEKVGLVPKQRTGDEVQAIVNNLYSVPPSDLERARKVFGYGTAAR
jgi:tripartite-type tricarboxylate transporter receptor subunit TctC